MDVIRTYVKSAFDGVASSRETIEQQQELVSDMEEKVRDLVAQGKSEREAISITIADAGDLTALASEFPSAEPMPPARLSPMQSMNLLAKQFVYLVLALPLGILYFVVMVVGLSLGVGLFVVGVGIPILTGVFAFATALCNADRAMLNGLLGAKIPVPSRIETRRGFWPPFAGRFTDRRTWMRVSYLVVKLPLGIVTFTVEITFFATSVLLILTPLIYGEWWYRFIGIGFWHINTLPTALAAATVGVLLAFVFYHASRGLAWVSAELARAEMA